MQKALILTPSQDGQLTVQYTHALTETIRLATAQRVAVQPIFIAYDALIERARNDLLAMALKSDCTDAIWIDGDEGWRPEWVFELLGYPVDVVGGTTRHKADKESYVVNAEANELVKDDNGLMPVRKLGTGFLRMSRKALEAVWERGVPYKENDQEKRWVFDARPVNGELYSEDTMLFDHLAATGFQAYLAPHMCCNHIGTKVWTGDFEDWLRRFNEQRKKAA